VRGDVLRDTLRIELPLVVLSVLWDTSRATVVHTTCDNIHYLYLLSGTHVRFLVTAAWMKYRVFFVWHRAMCLLAEPFRGRDRVVWLANSPAELRNGERERCASVFVNHNCFINERRFPLLTPAARPRFDAVINANAGVWKRHYLARDVPSLAYITYSKDENGGMKWPVDTFEPAWRNERYLDENERLEIYGDSCCGLTLSACEGANYATTEYLLCGLPVVSSHSLGGRDVWLTPSNSTICDPTYEAVAGAVATWRRRHDDGATDHAAIREHCVQQMLEHRDRFVTTLQRVFDDAGIRATARDIFTGLQESDQMFHALTFQRNPGAGGHPHCNGKGWHSLWELPPGMRSR
jgi:glycosyltransferase involved in cell wall biosynthesis